MTRPMQEPGTRLRPAAWWYALPVALAVVGCAVSALLLVTATDRLSGVDRQSGADAIAVGEQQLSVFADTTPTQAVASSSAGACSLTPVGGGEPVLTEASGIRLTFDHGSHHWVRIGVVASDTPSGAYRLACTGFSNDALAVASTDGVRSGALLLVAGIVVAIGSLVSAMIALLVVIVLRNRAKNRMARAG